MEASHYIWLDGELVAWDEAKVHVLSHGLHYGTGVFEGIRAYETPRGPAVFRHHEHMERLVRSARAYKIPFDMTAEELVKAAKQVLSANELNEAYIRPIVFLGLGSIGLNPAGASVHTAIAAWRWGAYLGEEGMKNGIRVVVSSWRRIDTNALIPNAKGTGAYLNSILARTEAERAGYDEAIMLTSSGFVSEGSGENVFVIRDGVVTTPPVADGILDGITRASVMQIMRDAGIHVIETSVTRSDLYHADELFLVGTAAEVTPVREVDDRTIGSGRPGTITQMVQDTYLKAVHGELAEYEHWLDYL